MSSGHDCSADHWALGIVIYEMIMGENPFYFEGMDQMVLFKTIVQDAHEPPDACSPEAVAIIDALLEKDPAVRLGSLALGESDILQHAWFSSLDLYAMRRRELTAPWIPALESKLDAGCFEDWSEIVDKQTIEFDPLTDREQEEFKGF